MRLRSDIFVSAYLRRRAVGGVPAYLRRRGAAEAGAIFIKIDRLDGTAALFGPAPQSLVAEDDPSRLFVSMFDPPFAPIPDVEERLAKEMRFDPDLWIVEVEDRAGEPELDLVAS